MKKVILSVLLFIVVFVQAKAQYTEYPPQTEKFNLGLGMGMDYGGIGLNALVYPQNNIGLFAGGGYALAGFGWNAGLKGRFFLNESSAITPYLMAMYGYNAAVK